MIEAGKATPESVLRERLMDSRVSKSELEWFAKREIEALTAALTQSQAEMANPDPLMVMAETRVPPPPTREEV